MPTDDPAKGAVPYRAETPLAEVIPPDHRRRNSILLALTSLVVGAALAGFVEQLLAVRRSTPVLIALKVERREANANGSLRLLQRDAGAIAADLTSSYDGRLQSDGVPDEALLVEASGAFVSLMLLTTDASGRPMGGQQWDTIVGNQPIPRETKSSYATGAQTWQLAVLADLQVQNAVDGSLRPLRTGPHSLTVYASGSRWFESGRYFRLYGELADGSLVESNVLAYQSTGAAGPPSTATEPVKRNVPSPDDTPFDRGAAAAALGGIDVQTCRRLDGPTGSGHLRVVFSPTGVVTSAEVDDRLFADTPAGSCVAAKFKGARIQAFSGAPVSVGKTFTITSPP